MLDQIIESGPLNEVLTVISRLQDFLPEYSRTKTDERFAEHWKAVEDLERQLAAQRALLREAATRILRRVEGNWSADEVKQATGYDL